MIKYNKWFKAAAAVAVILCYSIIMYLLFYRQCIAYEGAYISDMEAYLLEAQGLESGYDFPYPLMFWTARLFMIFAGPEAAMALAVTLLNSLSLVLMIYYFRIYMKRMVTDSGRKWGYGWEAASILLSLSLFFASMVFGPRGHGFFGYNYTYRCNGAYTPNPYWNATYMATRPFSIVCFFSSVTLLDKYEYCRYGRMCSAGEKIPPDKVSGIKDYIIFAASLFLTTITKPSYTLVAVITFAVILLWRFCKSKGKNTMPSIWFGLTFLPAGFALLYQYGSVFTGTNSQGEETGIGFAIGKAWSIYSDNIPLSMVRALIFPVVVLICNLPQLKKNTWFRHGWQVLTVGWLMMLCLYEKGFRLAHVNFSWGYMHGLFFVYTVSVFILLLNTLEAKGKLRKGAVAAGWLAYLWHVVCGIIYFLYIYEGNNSAYF